MLLQVWWRSILSAPLLFALVDFYWGSLNLLPSMKLTSPQYFVCFICTWPAERISVALSSNRQPDRHANSHLYIFFSYIALLVISYLLNNFYKEINIFIYFYNFAMRSQKEMMSHCRQSVETLTEGMNEQMDGWINGGECMLWYSNRKQCRKEKSFNHFLLFFFFFFSNNFLCWIILNFYVNQRCCRSLISNGIADLIW